MEIEARVKALEGRMAELEVEMRSMRPKPDQVLDAIVDVHNDIGAGRQEIASLRRDLPGIIATAVAPLVGKDRDT